MDIALMYLYILIGGIVGMSVAVYGYTKVDAERAEKWQRQWQTKMAEADMILRLPGPRDARYDSRR